MTNSYSPVSDADILVIMGDLPTIIGPYRIVRLLGEGGMGAVYEALHETIERRVAIKVLLPEYAHHRDVVNRFFNEARAVNRIEHPSLVQVSDFGHAPDGTSYMVMEYLRGETLTARLDHMPSPEQRLPLVEALQIAVQIADALAVAHAKGIVHRDLKPANIMLVPDPVAPGGERVKILDFGIAKLVANPAHGKGTSTHAVMGTPRYMSPEQCRGAGEVDPKTDVYALGVILYEMLAGRPPFLGEGSGDFIGQHMFVEPPPIRQFALKLPTEVAIYVHRLLLKDRSQRPTMAEVRAQLSMLLGSISGATAARSSVAVIDPEATRQLPARIHPSTLGESPGQTLPSSGRHVRGLRIAAAVLAATAGLTLALFGFGSHPFRRAPLNAPMATTAASAPIAPSRPAPAPLATEHTQVPTMVSAVPASPSHTTPSPPAPAAVATQPAPALRVVSARPPPPAGTTSSPPAPSPILPARPALAPVTQAHPRIEPARSPMTPAVTRPLPAATQPRPAKPPKLDPYDL